MFGHKKLFRIIYEFAVMTFASVLYSLAFCWFYLPNGMSVGGFTGISQIVNFLFPILPIGILTILLNVPFFIIGTKLQGFKLLFTSIYCMFTCSIFIDIINEIYIFQPMDDKILAAIFGGALVGVSSGIQMKLGATNGGTELTARLLKYKFHHVSVGKLCFAVDIIVIVLYGITFGNMINALYGIFSMYVFSIIVDMVIYGGTHAKMAYIISDESEKIKQLLLQMNFGITTIDSHGGWHGDEKQMIMCVVKRTQITAIKAAVTKIDPNAFIIVSEAHEVLGEGFGTYSPDQL